VGFDSNSRHEDPRKFPFDKYLVVYRVWLPVLAQQPDGKVVGILGSHEVDNHIAGFSFKYASPHEIETWSVPTISQSSGTPIRYDESMWAGRQNAIVLERSRFLKVITVFLAVVLSLYLVWFAFGHVSATGFRGANGANGRPQPRPLIRRKARRIGNLRTQLRLSSQLVTHRHHGPSNPNFDRKIVGLVTRGLRLRSFESVLN